VTHATCKQQSYTQIVVANERENNGICTKLCSFSWICNGNNSNLGVNVQSKLKTRKDTAEQDAG
jgi:hypothetical protein